MDYLVLAIKKLKPTSQFSFTNNDYSTIKWDFLEGKEPTQAQIEQAIEQVKAEEISQTQARATEKALLLERLGINADELNLLFS